jgi:hypothetical protein
MHTYSVMLTGAGNSPGDRKRTVDADWFHIGDFVVFYLGPTVRREPQVGDVVAAFRAANVVSIEREDVRGTAGADAPDRVSSNGSSAPSRV